MKFKTWRTVPKYFVTICRWYCNNGLKQQIMNGCFLTSSLLHCFGNKRWSWPWKDLKSGDIMKYFVRCFSQFYRMRRCGCVIRSLLLVYYLAVGLLVMRERWVKMQRRKTKTRRWLKVGEMKWKCSPTKKVSKEKKKGNKRTIIYRKYSVETRRNETTTAVEVEKVLEPYLVGNFVPGQR